MKILYILSLSLLMAGCSMTNLQHGTNIPVKPSIQLLDSGLTKECKDPVSLPDRELAQKEIEKYWSKDRYNLVDCKNRFKATVDVVNERDKGLNGTKGK